jgi:hypothetical protein
MPTKIKTALTPEASAIEQNEAAKAALITADEKTNRLSLAADEADLGMDSITDSWDAGDETASAEDYSLAAIEFKRATALHEAAIRSAQVIEKSIINTDTTLAAIVAPYVKATHPDYGDPGVSFLLPPKEMPDPNRPAVTVVQSKPVKRGQGGSMSGQVDIVLLRKSFHVELDSRKIEQAALKDGISLSISTRGTTPQGDHMVDNLHVIANSAHAAVPVIDITPSPAMARQFAQNLAAAFCGATRSTTDGPLRMHDGGVYDSAVATVEATNSRIVHIDTDASGKRFTEAEANLKWTTPNGRKPQHPMDTYLRRIVADQDGIFASGLGVVTKAKVESLGFSNPLGETEATVRVTFASAAH